jgi:hypothetical protein
MSDAAVTAVIAAGSAVFGGILSAYATRSVEAMRVRAGLREKADERRLAAVQRFANAAFAWFEWATSMGRGAIPTDEQAFEENNKRSRERQQAYRTLLLLSSADLVRWLTTEYAVVERRFIASYLDPVLWGRDLPADAEQARSEFSRVLRVDLIEQFRPEISALRDPVDADRHALARRFALARRADESRPPP